MKITIIGAASLSFSRKLLMDILTMKLSGQWEIILMGPRYKPLVICKTFMDKIIKENSLPFSVEITTNRKQALKGANYVITLFGIGGIDALKEDYKIPLQYNVDQCVGDSLGPGGIFRAQRSIPVFTGIIEDMKALCPEALLLNYVNPMAMLTMTAARLGWNRYLGLCGGIETTRNFIAHVLSEPKEELSMLFMGINHMAWVMEIKKGGKDLYPVFKNRLAEPGYLAGEKIRFDVMQHFGYFSTESSGHLSDFLSWYRKNDECRKLYCNSPGFHGASGAYFRYSSFLSKNIDEEDFYQFHDGTLEPRSSDYGASVIEAVETGKTLTVYGNVSNTEGYISNLPQTAAVEIPVVVEKGSIKPRKCGILPLQLAALNQTNIIVQELSVEAALTGDPELLVCALSLDPLTSSVLTPQECRMLARDMLEKQAVYLPQFKGKQLKETVPIKPQYGTRPFKLPEESHISHLKEFKKNLRKNKSKFSSNP